jgi:bacillithiol system protein YtxJ
LTIKLRNRNTTAESTIFGIDEMKEITSFANLEDMSKDSFAEPQIVFKHSTRCGISSMALHRMKSYTEKQNFHLVDVINQRAVSNHIAETFKTLHASPQLLIIHKGIKVFDTSHMGISAAVVEKNLSQITN